MSPRSPLSSLLFKAGKAHAFAEMPRTTPMARIKRKRRGFEVIRVTRLLTTFPLMVPLHNSHAFSSFVNMAPKKMRLTVRGQACVPNTTGRTSQRPKAPPTPRIFVGSQGSGHRLPPPSQVRPLGLVADGQSICALQQKREFGD